jgi:tetratricopeptide (TPR) repeat protein
LHLYGNYKSDALRELKRNEDALEAADRALALDPNFAVAWNNRGRALRALKRTYDAIQAEQRAKELGFKVQFRQSRP